MNPPAAPSPRRERVRAARRRRVGRTARGAAPVLLASLLAAGCSSTEDREGVSTGLPPASSGLRVLTELVPDQIAAGETAEVRCVVTTVAGQERPDEPTSVHLSPPEGVALAGHTLTGERVGVYEVSCALEATGAADPAPPTLTVVPGPPARVVAVPAASELVAGQSAAVQCLVFDAFGNALPSAVARPVGQPGLPAGGGEVHAELVGDYLVECALQGKLEVESVPGAVRVVAGEAVSVHLHVAPDHAVYARGAVVKLSWTVRDAFGNPASGESATLEAPGAGVSKVGALQYELTEQGSHTFTVSLLPPREHVQDSRTLLVDDAPPEVVLHWPARGETVQGDGAEPVLVQGAIYDASALKRFTIGGVDVEVGDGGAFTHPMMPRWGLNLIELEAEDALGNVTAMSPSFYFATEYLPYTDDGDAVAVRLPVGASMALAQSAFDDGVRDLNQPNDLADFITLALTLLDPMALLPPLALPPLEFTLPGVIAFELPGVLGESTSVVGDLEVSVQMGGPVLGPVAAGLDTRAGGIDMAITLGEPGAPALLLPITIKLAAPVTATVKLPNLLGGPPIELPFSLVGTSTIEGGLGIQKAVLYAAIDAALSPGGAPTLTLADSSLDFEGVGALPIQSAVLDFGAIDLPLIGSVPLQVDLIALAPQLFDLVELFALDPLWDLVSPLLSGALNPLLAAALEGVVEPLVDALQLELPLPLPLLGDPSQSVELQISVGPDTTVFTDDGGHFALGVGIAAPKGIDRDPLGLPLRGQCLQPGALGPLAPTWGSPAELVGRLDAANALLFALWWSGAMNEPLDLSALATDGGLPLDGLVLRPAPYLPPVLSDCEPSGPQLQIGDMYIEVDASVLGLVIGVRAYLHVALGVELEADADGWSLVLGEFDRVELEIVEVKGGLGGLFDLESLIEGTLLPMLTDSLPGTRIGPIGLPPLDLGGLLPGLPVGLTVEVGGYAIPLYPGRAGLGFALQ